MLKQAEDTLCELAIMWHLSRLAHIMMSGCFAHHNVHATHLEAQIHAVFVATSHHWRGNLTLLTHL